MINHSKSSILQSATRRNHRSFLVFCALTLLLGCTFSYIANTPATFNTQLAPTSHRFNITASVEELPARAADADHLHVQAPAKLVTTINDTSDKALHCDRSDYRTDVCVAQGDVRVVGGLFEVLVLADAGLERMERVKPYSRKWEDNVMATIDEVKVIRKVISSSRSRGSSLQEGLELAGAVARANVGVDVQKGEETAANYMHTQIKRTKPHKIRKRRRLLPQSGSDHAPIMPELNMTKVKQENGSPQKAVPICDVQHKVPAILFSTGGYTGNVYHEFNDGLIPLFITAQHYGPPAGRVVLLVLEYHSWWMNKYKEVVAQITNYPVVDLSHDSRVHCFPEVTVGLRIHDELSINAGQDPHASMERFQKMLRAAYRISNDLPTPSLPTSSKQPRLVVISRKGRSRILLNEKEVVGLARKVGFAVKLLRPTPNTRMAEIFGALSRCDAMLGVHGAAMTHLLFMRPGATFIQVVPLGTDWAAATYYGDPARKLGLNYVEYKVRAQESSLWQHYAGDDPVLVDPEAVNRRGGWWETKRIYLQAQNVTVSLPAMAALLRIAYARAAATGAAVQ